MDHSNGWDEVKKLKQRLDVLAKQAYSRGFKDGFAKGQATTLPATPQTPAQPPSKAQERPT